MLLASPRILISHGLYLLLQQMEIFPQLSCLNAQLIALGVIQITHSLGFFQCRTKLFDKGISFVDFVRQTINFLISFRDHAIRMYGGLIPALGVPMLSPNGYTISHTIDMTVVVAHRLGKIRVIKSGHLNNHLSRYKRTAGIARAIVFSLCISYCYFIYWVG